ncbi:pilus assembly protein TadG-related protein [Cryobacterium sp. MLB-32]|uniref:pilus assembly protein TadG-related protein n=1 Tax=Cryobacterium sp. MLB-32 TaxID=1529318 RepID=UPI000691DB53|nr:pilus assembly protein TadG-related protein [Cryobacterium sp. MLB-32]
MAIALDVGALYAERAQLQNGADAAALAIAQECAGPGCAGAAALAASYANANANDGAATALTPTFPSARTVTVTTTTRVAGTNAPAIHHPFAAFIGHDSSSVQASATAEWGYPGAARVALPLALSLCQVPSHFTGARVVLDFGSSTGCTSSGAAVPGGFGWLVPTGGDCGMLVDSRVWQTQSRPGNNFPAACDPTLGGLAGQTILIPVYNRADASGTNALYRIYGFVAFTVTGWNFSGGGPTARYRDDTSAPDCTGTCRGLQGFFTDRVSLDGSVTDLDGPDLGASVIRLIN